MIPNGVLVFIIETMIKFFRRIRQRILTENPPERTRSRGMSFDNGPKTKVIPIEGNCNPDRLIILEWDSTEQLQLFSESEEYLKIVGLRTNSASTKSIVVNEYIEN